MFGSTVVLVLAVGVTFAAQGISELEPKPDKYKNVEGCYVSVLDDVIPLNESRPSKTDCMELTCYEDSVLWTSCGTLVVDPPLELVEDKRLPFPDCCPKPKDPITSNV